MKLRPTARIRAARAGYSLIEVLVGTALLAVVGLTIAGLFTKGRHEVDSAANLTLALAVAQHVAEDLDSVAYESLRSVFTTSSATTDRALFVRYSQAPLPMGWQVEFTRTLADGSAVDIAAAKAVTTPSAPTADDPTDPTAEPVETWGVAWRTELEDLPKPELEITMTAMFDIDDDPATNVTPNTAPYPAPLDAAQMIRIDVTVRWREGDRDRFVTIPQARTYFEV